jgi:hypothetical protein
MKSTFARVATLSGLVLGAFAMSALAGTWTAPTATPPAGNVDAPVNIGAITQTKLGWLGVRGLIATDFTLATGTPVAGQVLTAIDSLGTAAWATPTGGMGGSLGRVYSYHQYTTFTNGVSANITIPGLPNGDTMTSASLKWVGSSQLSSTNGYTLVDTFGDQNAYVEIVNSSTVRVHLLGNTLTTYTGTSNTAEVYLTIYTGGGGGSSGGPSSYSSVLLDAPTVLYSRTTQVADSAQSGSIQAGVTAGVPAGAKGVLLYGKLDENSSGVTRYIRFKHTSQTNWKNLVYSLSPMYGVDNSVWVPLDSSGKLDWQISASTAPEDYRLEIQGYEVY